MATTSSGSCNGTESTSDERYYIFSFSYGILAVSSISLSNISGRVLSRVLCDTLFVTKVLLLVHVVTHHLWRRRKLKRNQTTIVEITANTSKVRIHIFHQSHNHPANRRYGRAQKLKEELDRWSRRIKNLNPNPKLISTEVSPVEYGNGLGKPLRLFVNCYFQHCRRRCTDPLVQDESI